MTTPHLSGDTWAPERLILAAEVGSGAHGMALAGRDDTDIMGVYVEPPETVFGIAGVAGHLTRRTKPTGARSEHNDVDEMYYGLRHYVQLATDGNPSITMLLFLERDSFHRLNEWGRILLDCRGAIVSRHTVYRFAGYLREQKMRFIASTPELRGVSAVEVPKLNRVPKRPELIEAYGYDTKYASHALRLAHQGYELLTTGELRYPMNGEALADCMAIKSGEIREPKQALEMIEDAERALELALTKRAYTHQLPERPHYESVNAMLEAIFRGYYDAWPYTPTGFDHRPARLQKEEQ